MLSRGHLLPIKIDKIILRLNKIYANDINTVIFYI